MSALRRYRYAVVFLLTAAPPIFGDDVWPTPKWETATPEQAQAVHAFIRGKIAKLDQNIADGLRILYGGSMNPANAAELQAQPDIDGGLIGGASLKPDDFLAICKAGN